MTNCPKCQQRVAPKWKKCLNCGAALGVPAAAPAPAPAPPPPPNPGTCPSCQEPISPKWRKCLKCGAVLAPPPPRPARAPVRTAGAPIENEETPAVEADWTHALFFAVVAVGAGVILGFLSFHFFSGEAKVPSGSSQSSASDFSSLALNYLLVPFLAVVLGISCGFLHRWASAVVGVVFGSVFGFVFPVLMLLFDFLSAWDASVRIFPFLIQIPAVILAVGTGIRCGMVPPSDRGEALRASVLAALSSVLLLVLGAILFASIVTSDRESPPDLKRGPKTHRR